MAKIMSTTQALKLEAAVFLSEESLRLLPGKPTKQAPQPVWIRKQEPDDYATLP